MLLDFLFLFLRRRKFFAFGKYARRKNSVSPFVALSFRKFWMVKVRVFVGGRKQSHNSLRKRFEREYDNNWFMTNR